MIEKLLRFFGIWKCRWCGGYFDSRDTTWRFRKSPYCDGNCLEQAMWQKQMDRLNEELSRG